MCVVQAGVAALVLDNHRLDGELRMGQGGTEPHPSLVRWLNHWVTPLCEGSHFCGGSLHWSVSPYNLLRLLREAVGAQEGHLLAAYCCLVVFYYDLCWRVREKTQGHHPVK